MEIGSSPSKQHAPFAGQYSREIDKPRRDGVVVGGGARITYSQEME